MTKSTSKARSKTSVKVAGATIKATPVRRKKVAPVSQDSVTETTPVVEAPVVEAPKAEAVFVIPDMGVADLVVSREGYRQLPGKTWHRLTGRFGKHTVRQAIAVMVALADIRLPLALELATWPAFRPHMVQQLAIVAANKDTLCVLEWVWSHQDWSWKEAYTAFPRSGFPGCKATKAEIGKFNKLVSLLDALRKEGKTSIRSIDILAQAAHLIGWIK